MLKPDCVQMARKAMEWAEKVGHFREMVNRQEEKLEADLRRGIAYGAEPLIEDRKRMFRDKKEELKYEEQQFLELVDMVVKCECQG